MVARRRLITSLKELLFGSGFVLLCAAGLPLLFTQLGADWSVLPTWRLWGVRFLWASPLVLLVLFGRQWQYVTGRYRRAQRKLEGEGITYYLLPRADAPPVRADRVTLWSRVVDVLPRDEHVSWEVMGAADSGVRFAMRATPGVDRALLTQITAEWPGTQARPVAAEDEPLRVSGRASWWCELYPQSSDRGIEAVADDPLRAALAELGRLSGGVQAGVQLLVRGDPFTRQRLGQKAARALHRQRGKPGDKYHLPATLEERRRTQSLDQRAQRATLEVRLLVWATAGSEAMAQSVVHSLARAVTSQYTPANPLRVAKRDGAGTLGARAFPIFAGRGWTDLELGALAHVVGQDVRAIVPQLATAPANPLPPSPACRVPRGARLSARLKQGEAAPQAAALSPTQGPLLAVEEVAHA